MTPILALPSELFEIWEVKVKKTWKRVESGDVSRYPANPVSVLSDRPHGGTKVAEEGIVGGESAAVKVNCNIKWRISSVCHLPSEEIRVLALEMDV